MKKPLNLKKSEFYNIYALSLLLTKENNKEILSFILPIANKYYHITKYAIYREAKYFFDKRYRKESINNYSLLLQLNKNVSKNSLQIIKKLFNKGDWADEYGGKLWGKIVKTCIKLEKLLKKPNSTDLILQIDYMNSLEHNTELYMTDFCSFDYYAALNNVFLKDKNFIIKNASLSVKNLYTKLNYQNNSLVYLYHKKEGQNDKRVSLYQ